jgi:predicted nucleotidyltransferase component of viral defense system
MLTPRQLQEAAGAQGFQIESFEKVHSLVRLLNGIRSHPYLSTRMALKGGTALNLFVFDLPRLSVDIDLNYVGAIDRETLLAERPLVEKALEQVAGRLNITVKRAPEDHAGGKWRLSYTTGLGRPGSIELDVNYMLRSPLWPAGRRDSHPIGGEKATEVLVLDDHELAAGKLAALVARRASRDLFDARELLQQTGLDRRKLRLGFVIYGGFNRVDWREISIDHVRTTTEDVDSQLVPMLRLDVRPERRNVEAWTRRLVEETRELMAAVLPLEANEREFLEHLNGAGDIAPELLTGDALLQTVIREHPNLKWKALNVKKHRGKMATPDASA